MKKIVMILLACLMLVVFAAGCKGTYTPPITMNPGGGSGSGTENPGGGSETPGENEGVIFTVRLIVGGKNYTPDRKIYAQWTGENDNYTAEFNSAGIATSDKPDGEYRVTISNLPDTYTYNPNGIYVDNDNPTAIIELFPITATRGLGSDKYNDRIDLRTVGTYRAVFNSGSQNIWYAFTPTRGGWYSIESWVDCEANEINPILYYYGTATFAETLKETCNTGGASSTFTKNFRFEIQLTSASVNTSWVFLLRIDSVSGVRYPVNVDFTIKYEGNYEEPEIVYEEQVAKGPFERLAEPGSWRYTYEDTPGRILQESRVKLWKKADGGDDFYHLYDKVVYAANDGYGPTLFAKIKRDTEVFADIWAGNDGFTNGELVSHGGLRFQGENGVYKDYTNFIYAYANYCNGAGAHPVTAELKQFLQEFAVSGRLFNDGDGTAESSGYTSESGAWITGPMLNSDEASMWLFACGYYR